MSQCLYADLAWLPRAPEDFVAQCKALELREADLGASVAWLASHALDEAAMRRLARAVGAAQAARRSLEPLTPFRLGVIGTGTLDLVAPALVVGAARHGIALECIVSEFGQAVPDALDPDSRINRARPDAVLILLDHRSLGFGASPGDAKAATTMIEAALCELAAMRASLRKHGGATSIVQTVAPPAETMFGSLDRALDGTLRKTIDLFNAALVASLAASEDVLLDTAGIAETVGLAAWHAPTQWNLAKLPFAHACIPLFADYVGRLLGALRGRSRKCLVLDLDNTLWGGVIGDDGLNGIVLGQGDPTGEAFLDIQRMALSLRDRGIVLAVCSKNNDATARTPFRDHPDMLLREAHIAVFQANWQDKASNIKAIAETLSLGVDSMVFLDDNPVERDLVRRMVPEVAVPELPEDPALYARTLAAAGYFEAVAFSAEDRARAASYQLNAERAALRETAGDVGTYLASLDMEIGFAPFDAVGRGRIAQLINKSNQFNLTTRRYTEADVAAAERDPSVFTLQIRLTDRFGDNGMISVVIGRPRDVATWEIDTWLMSCRVLGRQVEKMVLREILVQARARGVTSVLGLYRPTARNALVRDHYLKLGFEKFAGAAEGGGEPGDEWWRLDTAAIVEPVPMAVRWGGRPTGAAG